MFRKCCLMLSVALVLLLGFYYDTLLNVGIRLYLEKKSAELGVPLAYSSVESSPHSIVFHDTEVVLQGGSVKAKKLVVEHYLHPLKRHIDINIVLENPNLNVEKELVNLEKIIQNLNSDPSFFTISGKVCCTDGSLSLNSDDEKKIFFHFDHQWDEQGKDRCLHTGSYFLNLSEKDKTSTLKVFFSAADPTNVELNANLQKVQAGKLSDALKPFFPEFAAWHFKQGILDGEFSFAIANAKFVQGKGELTVSNLETEQKDLGITAIIKKAIFCTDAQTGHASLDFLENGSITFSDYESYASFKDFNGKVEITDADHLELHLSGVWEDKQKPLHTEMRGSLHLNELADLFVKISLNTLDFAEEPSFISIDAKRLGGSNATAQIDLQRFGPKQFHFWQRALENAFPDFTPLIYRDGSLDALLKLTLNKDKIESIKIENINAADVALIFKPWEAAFSADKLSGQFAINFLNPKPQDTLNADLHIKNGQTSVIGLSSEFWHFNHIETHLLVRDGIIQKSFARVELAGLKGSAEVNSFSEREILRFELEGNAVDLKPFLPERMQIGIAKQMAQEHLIVNASVSKIANGVQVVGDLKIKNSEGFSLPISFGFDIERASEDFLNSSELFSAYDEISLPFLQELSSLEERLLLRESGIQGFILQKGWFTANNVNLSKFISPFLFAEDNFSLKGFSNFKGTFDHLGLTLRYDAKSMILENDALNIDVEKITSSCTHYFDFVTGRHFGELPIKNGSYFDKNSGLFFSEVNAHVLFEGKKIHVLDVDAFSNGLYFGGNIDIDYSNPAQGVFDLEIMISMLHGKVSQVQHFFSHFNKHFFFQSLPLDGDIALRNKGCRLTFHFTPDDFTLATVIDGSISDAILKPENSELSIQALSMNFTFDSQKSLLDFSDLQGTLLTGKPSQIDEYTLHSNRIHFSNYENNEAEFDIWVKDQNRDLIRLSGNTKTLLNEDQEKEIVFSFDPSLTHFGEIHPKKIALALTDWTKIAKAKLDFSFRLSTLLYDLQRFGKSGLLFSSSFLKEISNLKNAGGDCEVALNYDSATSSFNFWIQGNDVTFDQYSFKNVTLAGKNQDKIWTIDQLQLDQLSLAAEFSKNDSLWKANFLGLRYGKSLLVGMEGEHEEGAEAIKARVNLLEVNLAKLKEWPELASFSKQFMPQGILKGSGEINFEFFKGSPFRFDIDLDATLANAKLKDLDLKDCSHFHCHYASDKGMTFQDVSTSVVLEEQPFQFHFDSIHFDNQEHHLHFSGGSFHLPAEKLPFFVTTLNENFPDLISEDLSDIMSNIKKSGSLIGEMDVKKFATHANFQLKLADDRYFFNGQEHFLRSFTLHSDPKNISFATQYQLNQHPFSLTGKIDAQHYNRGELELRDDMHKKNPALEPLVVHWKKDAERGFVIDQANGFFGGMLIQLAENQASPSTSSDLHLEGEVFTLNDQFRHVFDDEISEQLLKWQVGQGYVLQGTFTFAKDPEEATRPFTFYGSLSGQDFHLKGYQFKQLHAQVLCGTQNMQVSDVRITDPAGALYINQIIITEEEGQSRLSIPLLNIQELRPSFLVEVGKPLPNQKKPLVIRELNIHDIKGILGSETSFTGKGSLNFINPVKKHLQNTIFAFPAEILTRIGLNLSVLTPVIGTINYEIYDGKVFLTKFKDIYSDSRLSRFYLPNSRTASYMDFDGNLNIQVKMKQHTLIFKLAELFTVNIQGNLQNPTYTLLRQKPLRRSEVIASSKD